MNFALHVGNSLDILPTLPEKSVHTCVTSPPYFGLRDYGNPEQIGLEPTPEAYVQKLVQVFREVRRVLRDDGTLWLNLGDSYAAGGGSGKQSLDKLGERLGCGGGHKHSSSPSGRAPTPAGLKQKDLIGIPWRVAFALQADGWYLRSDIIWHKPNPMPESVTDRPTKAHEYLFLLSKRPNYYYDHEAVREENSSPAQLAHNLRYAKTYDVYDDRAGITGQPGNVNNVGIHSRPGREGRNRRSVWTVATRPFSGAHFAVFPLDLIRPCVLAGSPPNGVVLDPFTGSGTTGLVAAQHGRSFVGIELSETYAETIAKPRLDSAYGQVQLLVAS